MFISLGLLALISSILSLSNYISGKDHRLKAAIALILTSLSLVSKDLALLKWVGNRDWAAIEDVIPTMTKVYLPLILIITILNLMPLALELRKEGKKPSL